MCLKDRRRKRKKERTWEKHALVFPLSVTSIREKGQSGGDKTPPVATLFQTRPIIRSLLIMSEMLDELVLELARGQGTAVKLG